MLKYLLVLWYNIKHSVVLKVRMMIISISEVFKYCKKKKGNCWWRKSKREEITKVIGIYPQKNLEYVALAKLMEISSLMDKIFLSEPKMSTL